MSADPAVNLDVAQQVDAIPSWILPLWANWPLLLLGAVMLVVMLRISHVLRTGLRLLMSKMIDLEKEVGNHQHTTQQHLAGLDKHVQALTRRVTTLEVEVRTNQTDAT